MVLSGGSWKESERDRGNGEGGRGTAAGSEELRAVSLRDCRGRVSSGRESHMARVAVDLVETGISSG